ncbi:hypothetical protein MMC13_001814 [Lambiella insularis]|nr:hypothetical protein [Lambiella insularis]
MAECEHIGLLQVVAGKQIILQDEGRMERAVAAMTNPSWQRPSLLFFLGRKSKDQALHALFPFNTIKKGYRESCARLRIDNATINSDNPILFADSELNSQYSIQSETPNCHVITAHSVQWSLPFNHKLSDVLHARLFFLFADVICVFADDIGGLQSVAETLKEWASIGSAADASKKLRPRVIIVTSGESASPTYDVLDMDDLRFSLLRAGELNLHESFSGVCLLQLPGSHISSSAKHRRLKEVLLKHADEMRRIRIEESSLFTGTHLSSLYRQALSHTAKTWRDPFNLIVESRKGNLVEESFTDHVTTFLKLAIALKIPYDDMALFIASAILLDAYPPDMHGKTDPTLLNFSDPLLSIRI